MKKPIADRLWERVSGLDDPDGCWEWQGARQTHGYGQIMFNAKSMVTHRLAWELTNGPIPDGMLVLHHCDNPPCVNPRHLFLGTQADNMSDKNQKKRGKYIQGENHPRAKLTEIDIQSIRHLLSIGYTQVELANKFGVWQTSISAIKRRETWKHVT